jgi:short subunit dehydrogenase
MKNNGGRIVVTPSTAGLCGAYGQANYAASKMGVQGLVRTIAWEGRQYGIQANIVAPSASDHRYAANPTFSADNPAYANWPAELAIPAGVFSSPHRNSSARVTPIVPRLLHESCPVTGETYAANGGVYHRFAMIATDGTVLPGDPTAEDGAAHRDDIHGAGRLPGELDNDVIVRGIKTYADKFKHLEAERFTR